MALQWSSVSRTCRVFTTATLLCLAQATCIETALAQPSSQELVQAREMFREGLQLEAAGDWAGALAKFQGVARIKMTPQVRFHIARCQHRLGNFLEALGGYRLSAHEAASDPKSANVVKEAQAGMEELEAIIPKLTIVRGKGAETASAITLDGVSLGETSIGKEVPVNPGVHTIEFTLSDGSPQRQVVSVQEKEAKSVELTAEAKPIPEKTPPKPPPDVPAEPRPEPKSNVLPWVVMGVGGASLIASGTFYYLRSGAIDDLDGSCVDNVCPTSMKDTGDQGKMYTLIGNITLGVGIAGVGLGTVLLLTGGSSSKESPKASGSRMTVVVGATDTSAEAAVLGVF